MEGSGEIQTFTLPSFIEADRGEHGKPRGEDAQTRRSKDGASSVKNNQVHFGYKDHTLVSEIAIIEKLTVTPANVHDSQIDLSITGIPCYRDKGYFGSGCKGIDATMDRGIRGGEIGGITQISTEKYRILARTTISPMSS